MWSRLQEYRRVARSKREDQAFLAAGNPPWRPGYERHKVNAISVAINDPTYDPDRLAPNYGWRLDERIIEYPWFIHRLPHGPGRLLDAGSTLNHPHVLAHQKLREKSCFISTLAPEYWSAWQWKVSYVYEDLRETCFRDSYFDFAACISTIEHVGLDNTMIYTSDEAKRECNTSGYQSCLLELKRVLRPGGTLYLSMPFGRHVNHGWFQVFDSAMVDKVLNTFAPTSSRELVYQYLSDGWVVSARDAAREATYFDVHKQKDYDPDYAAASRAVVCLELVK